MSLWLRWCGSSFAKWFPFLLLWRIVGLASVWRLKVSWSEGNGRLPQKLVCVCLMCWLGLLTADPGVYQTAQQIRWELCLDPLGPFYHCGAPCRGGPSLGKASTGGSFSRAVFGLMEPVLLMLLPPSSACPPKAACSQWPIGVTIWNPVSLALDGDSSEVWLTPELLCGTRCGHPLWDLTWAHTLAWLPPGPLTCAPAP